MHAAIANSPLAPAALPPTVSVIVPCFRSGGHIDACLDSLAKQRGVCFEVIVIDDACPDRGDPTHADRQRVSEICAIRAHAASHERIESALAIGVGAARELPVRALVRCATASRPRGH